MVVGGWRRFTLRSPPHYTFAPPRLQTGLTLCCGGLGAAVTNTLSVQYMTRAGGSRVAVHDTLLTQRTEPFTKSCRVASCYRDSQCLDSAMHVTPLPAGWSLWGHFKTAEETFWKIIHLYPYIMYICREKKTKGEKNISLSILN